jgi:transcription-repair coupling factor (superfamily II helicase)
MDFFKPNLTQSAYAIARLVLNLRADPSNFASTNSICVVVATNTEGEFLANDLSFFLNKTAVQIRTFFGSEVLPFDLISPSAEISGGRIKILSELIQNSANQEQRPTIYITTIESSIQFIIPREALASATLKLQVGMKINREYFLTALDLIGYVRTTIVEEIGQFAVRGAVIDLFSPSLTTPLRLEFVGDELVSIREFDSDTQRSRFEHQSINILPVREFLPPWVSPQQIVSSGYQIDEKILACANKNIEDRAQSLDLSGAVLAQIKDALNNVSHFPGIEQLLALYDERRETFWSYFKLLPHGQVLFLEDQTFQSQFEYLTELVEERATLAKSEERLFPEITEYALSPTDFYELLKDHTILTSQAVRKLYLPQDELLVALKRTRHHELPFQVLADYLLKYQTQRTAIIVSHRSKAKRFQDLLATYDIIAETSEQTFLEWQSESSARQVTLLFGDLSSGLVSPEEGLSIIADHELLPDIARRAAHHNATQVRRFIGTLSQIREADAVVHIDHGIALFRGIRTMSIDGVAVDFLHLEFAEEAKLFVPIEQIAKIQKYIGTENSSPKLSKLGHPSWSNTKERVRKQLADLAGQLLNLYASREIVQGHSFGAIDTSDQEFAATFPFEETADQERSIKEVLTDLDRTQPMDRLVCGDVGYGKTEVALRAAFKVMMGGKQVALLVPTTVLAEQHFNSCVNRFEGYPFKIRCLSRFRTKAENSETVDLLAQGQCDLVIGTHRLLQKDISFSDLGLVIIDEEHRFGVAHKERLKKMRTSVHVLTLTATPIPRTLQLSLLGIRDLSVIETPPHDRQVTRTFLSIYRAEQVREAILRELGRGGQVFYISNRVQTIAEVTNQLRELVPEARIIFGHGQMSSDELEDVMKKFISHEVDVLVSTTIVESGLDIPNANTIIITTAENFGLAELYQLRGRVGRSSRRAYAYLLVSKSENLSDNARKRLQVLQALDDLGVGFRLALHDMEIRGAGNLLGSNQSGKIELVGFELYSKILKEAVETVRRRSGEAVSLQELEELSDPEISLGFPAFFPSWYVPDTAERLLLYQRLVELRDEGEGRELFEEIVDRYGKAPREVEALVETMMIRAYAKLCGILSVRFRTDKFSIIFHPSKRELLKSQLSISGSLTIAVDPDQIYSPIDLLIILKDHLKNLAYHLN